MAYRGSSGSGQRPKTVNGGALFASDRKVKDTDPDYTGTMVLDRALTESILEQYKETGEFRIRIIAYKNTSERAGVWLKLMAKKDEPRAAGQREFKPQRRSEQSERRNPWET